MTSPLIVNGEFKKIPITIYGERHDHIDQTFYEGLDLSDKSVWVEHSTQFCELDPKHEHLFKKAKGLEWVWYTLVNSENPALCIDARLDLNFLPRVEEIKMERIVASANSNQKLKLVIDMLTAQFQHVLEMAGVFSATGGEIAHDFSAIQEKMMEMFQSIMKDFDQLLKMSDKDRAQRLFEKLHEDCSKFLEHLLLVSSMSVDAIIIQNLKEYSDDRPIHLFVGMNHAIRLQYWLRLEVVRPMVSSDAAFDVAAQTAHTLSPLASHKGKTKNKKK